jgi:hypothetical protein
MLENLSAMHCDLVRQVPILCAHACLLTAICWWHLRAYRKAARASRRRVERMLATAKSEALEVEVEYLRHRQETLLRGLFPKGDVFPGNFIDEDPELRALCELLEIFRGSQVPQPGKPTT